jgi:inner membrane protein
VEPVTHLLFGGVMARAGLNRKSALATATLVLAAEAPDLDVFNDLGGRVFGFEHHRGFSHTFLGVPVVAAFVLLVVWLYWRFVPERANKARAGGPSKIKPSPRWGLLYAFACLAAASHILLDFTNNYGIRPLEPFSYRWYSWDIVFIIEPVLWLILAGGLVLPSFLGMITDEVSSSRRHGPRGRAVAVFALVLVAAFWAFRDYEHRRAVAQMDVLTYLGHDPVRVSAYPYLLNPFRWYGVVETPGFYQSMVVTTLLPGVDPDDHAGGPPARAGFARAEVGMVRYKPAETAVTLAAKQSHLGRIYLDWARYPLLEVEQLEAPEQGYLVRFYDLRFMYPEFASRRTLSAWVQLDTNLQVVGQSFGPWPPSARSVQARK